MCVVDSSDLVLQYMVKNNLVTKQKIMEDMSYISNELVKEGVYSEIDFKYYNDEIISDMITNNLWHFLSSNIIKKHRSELKYEITDFGKKISSYLLSSFQENETVWGKYNKIIDGLS